MVEIGKTYKTKENKEVKIIDKTTWDWGSEYKGITI